MVAVWHFLWLGIKFLILVKPWSWDEPKLFKPRLPQLAFTPPSPISKLKCIIKTLHLYPLFPSIICVRISFLSKIFESKKVYYKQLSICWKRNTSKKKNNKTNPKHYCFSHSSTFVFIKYQVENFPWTCSLLHKAVYHSQ